MSESERGQGAHDSGGVVPPARTSVAKAARTARTTARRASAGKVLRSSSSGTFTQATRPTTGGTHTFHGPSKSSVSAAIDGAVDRYRCLLEAAAETERTLLMAAVRAEPEPAGEPALDEALFGPAPTEAEATASELDQLKLTFERRREVASSALSREAAAALLEMSKQAVLDQIRAGALVGLREGNRWLLPSWQFDADAERGYLPGIAEVSAAFPGGVVSLSRWVMAPNVEFDSHSPRQVMADGGSDAVAELAGTLTAAGW